MKDGRAGCVSLTPTTPASRRVTAVVCRTAALRPRSALGSHRRARQTDGTAWRASGARAGAPSPTPHLKNATSPQHETQRTGHLYDLIAIGSDAETTAGSVGPADPREADGVVSLTFKQGHRAPFALRFVRGDTAAPILHATVCAVRDFSYHFPLEARSLDTCGAAQMESLPSPLKR